MTSSISVWLRENDGLWHEVLILLGKIKFRLRFFGWPLIFQTGLQETFKHHYYFIRTPNSYERGYNWDWTFKDNDIVFFFPVIIIKSFVNWKYCQLKVYSYLNMICLIRFNCQKAKKSWSNVLLKKRSEYTDGIVKQEAHPIILVLPCTTGLQKCFTFKQATLNRKKTSLL